MTGFALKRSILSGTVATAVMTMVIMAAPYLGFPPMSPAGMLSAMFGVPILIGWTMHVMIGIFFTSLYGLVFLSRLNQLHLLIKGAIYGVLVFIFAQVVMLVMNALMGTGGEHTGDMGLQIVGGMLVHIVFGVVVALTIRSFKEGRP